MKIKLFIESKMRAEDKRALWASKLFGSLPDAFCGSVADPQCYAATQNFVCDGYLHALSAPVSWQHLVFWWLNHLLHTSFHA
jgi:hypothetical protein